MNETLTTNQLLACIIVIAGFFAIVTMYIGRKYKREDRQIIEDFEEHYFVDREGLKTYRRKDYFLKD